MKARLVLAITAAAISFSGFSSVERLCQGFVPENDLKIPVEAQSRLGGGITEDEFKFVVNRLNKYYSPVIAKMGASLKVYGNWKDATVNAYADRTGSTYQVHFFGGLARAPGMTADGFELVACHEMGHHIGGAPKKAALYANRWASNEGQSDYFAGLRCLRQLWPVAETKAFVKKNSIDPLLTQACKKVWKTEDDRNLCARIGMAGMSTATVFRWMANDLVKPKFNTPDPARVTQTDESHPRTQCRLDTYFQSGLCVHNMNQALSSSDERIGTCTKSAGFTYGNRPRCWYSGTY